MPPFEPDHEERDESEVRAPKSACPTYTRQMCAPEARLALRGIRTHHRADVAVEQVPLAEWIRPYRSPAGPFHQWRSGRPVPLQTITKSTGGDGDRAAAGVGREDRCRRPRVSAGTMIGSTGVAVPAADCVRQGVFIAAGVWCRGRTRDAIRYDHPWPMTAAARPTRRCKIKRDALA